MYIIARLLAINCLDACSFTVRGMRILLQKLHMYKTFAKDLYSNGAKYDHLWCDIKICLNTAGVPKSCFIIYIEKKKKFDSFYLHLPFIIRID